MIRTTLVIFGLASALCAGAALADPRPVVSAKGMAVQCLEPTGERRSASCRRLETSRIASEPDICICEGGLREVRAPYCAPGETPAPDSAAANTARRKAADAGTLATARFEGRRFCEAPGG